MKDEGSFKKNKKWWEGAKILQTLRRSHGGGPKGGKGGRWKTAKGEGHRIRGGTSLRLTTVQGGIRGGDPKTKNWGSSL